MELPAMGPAMGSVMFGLAQLNTCWRDASKTVYKTTYAGRCGRKIVSDIGLCDEHLEELKELG